MMNLSPGQWWCATPNVKIESVRDMVRDLSEVRERVEWVCDCATTVATQLEDVAICDLELGIPDPQNLDDLQAWKAPKDWEDLLFEVSLALDGDVSGERTEAIKAAFTEFREDLARRLDKLDDLVSYLPTASNARDAAKAAKLLEGLEL